MGPAPNGHSSESVLYSLGKKVGFGILAMVCYVMIRSAEWVLDKVKGKQPPPAAEGATATPAAPTPGSPTPAPASSTSSSPSGAASLSPRISLTVEQLKDPKTLQAKFGEDPCGVLDFLFEEFLIDKDKVRPILENLLTAWKENPSQFVEYKSSDEGGRKMFVSLLDEIFHAILMTRQQREFQHKVNEQELTGEELAAISPSSSPSGKGSPAAKRARDSFVDLEQRKSHNGTVWAKIHTFLCSSMFSAYFLRLFQNEVVDLNLSFGVCIEAALKDGALRKLCFPENRKSFLNCINQLFLVLGSQNVPPKAKALIHKGIQVFAAENFGVLDQWIAAIADAYVR
jgi:hypothetical protein